MCFTWLRPYWWIEVPGNNILVLRTRKSRLDLTVPLMYCWWVKSKFRFVWLETNEKPEVQSFTYTKVQIIKAFVTVMTSISALILYCTLFIFFLFEPAFLFQEIRESLFWRIFRSIPKDVHMVASMPSWTFYLPSKYHITLREATSLMSFD